MTELARRSSTFVEAVKQHYDTASFVYPLHSARMQGTMASRLDQLIDVSVGESVPRNCVALDLGSGSTNLYTSTQLQDAKWVLVDLSWRSCKRAAAETSTWHTVTVVNADMTSLPFSGSVASVVRANSSLHWLAFQDRNEMNARQMAVAEIRRVLVPGGCFAASVAADGTADRLMAILRGRTTLTLPHGVRDYVGSIRLAELVGECLSAGFDLAHASVEYEPIAFPSAAAYVDAVRAYGDGILVRLETNLSDDEWNTIAIDLQQGAEGHFVHHQFVAYVVCVVPNR